ncbi:hypothetical protein [Kribbella deserti]|uniref:MFS transporter n=1 Tax=Kribbella deserti TaxID=1926257 RepID=A0ABV6QMU3_9ACTN
MSFSIIVLYILQASARQLLCPAGLNGRVSATMSFVAWGAMPVGSVLGGVLATVAGLRPALWITAGAIMLSAGWLLFSPYRRLRDLPEGSVKPDSVGDDLRGADQHLDVQ